MGFGEALVAVVFLAGLFISVWLVVGVRFVAKQNTITDTGQDERLRRLEAEVAELRDLLHTALIEQDDPRFRELDAVTVESATVRAG